MGRLQLNFLHLAGVGAGASLLAEGLEVVLKLLVPKLLVPLQLQVKTMCPLLLVQLLLLLDLLRLHQSLPRHVVLI